MILILFAETYPYNSAAEQTFLDIEIQILAKRFDRVILIPRRCDGVKCLLPDKVEINTSYSMWMAKKSHFAVFLQPMFLFYVFHDLVRFPSVLLHGKALMRLVKFVRNALLTRIWVDRWLASESISPRDCIFYTYWFDDTAFGLGLARKRYSEMRVVSRTHGYDLYEERYEFPYWPCRWNSISLVDRLFPDSLAGLKYLQRRYPEFALRYEVGLLGVANQQFLSRPSHDGVLRIVSCSKIVPVKRVELILQAVKVAARLRSDIQFHWIHFGEGDIRDHMLVEAGSLPENAHAEFPGYESQQALFLYYRDNPVDVFINTSISEGTPVAVMEAISCGIPVVATAVGGNVEIVSEKNGWLLPFNPTLEEIALALISFHRQTEISEMKRKGSFNVWREYYNADLNFSKFAESLISLRMQRG